MSEEKKDSKKCGGKKKIMFAYGFIQLGSSFVSAIALAAIAFGFCSVKKESKAFNSCVTEIIENGNTNAEAVRYCNGGNWFNLLEMKSNHSYILECLKDKPIGETVHFVWYITDIGIAALFKGNENSKIYNLIVENEAINLNLDISKEEKEYFEIEDQKLFLFYS